MKRILILLAFVLAAGVSQAQFLTAGIRLGYGSNDLKTVYSDIYSEVSDMSNFTTFLQDCNAGLMFRLKFGKRFYVQPEANFSINSVWDSVDVEGDVLGKLTASFDHLQSVSLAVPVLVGFKLFEIEDFLNFRIFAGPEFYTSIQTAQEQGFNFETWSALAGIGIDLMNFLYVDVRATYLKASEMSAETEGNKNIFYSFGVSLLL